MHIIEVADATEAGAVGARLIGARAIADELSIALPGGRSVAPLFEALAEEPQASLENLRVRLADERIFGEKNEDVIREHLIAPLDARGITIDFKAPVRDGERSAIIESYERTIDTVPFDVLVASSGEDGHVLGLYPDYPQLDSDKLTEAFADSPKPPPGRMTTTLRCYDPEHTLVILLFLGEGKREAYRRFLEEPDFHELPAAYFHRFERAYAITDQHV